MTENNRKEASKMSNFYLSSITSEKNNYNKMFNYTYEIIYSCLFISEMISLYRTDTLPLYWTDTLFPLETIFQKKQFWNVNAINPKH